MSVHPIPSPPTFLYPIREETKALYDADYEPPQQAKTRSRHMSEPFVMVPSKLITAALSPEAKLVYLLLLDRRNNNTGDCHPTISSIAEDVNQSERHTKRVLQELERSGWIVRKRVAKIYHYAFPTDPKPVEQVTPESPINTKSRDTHVPYKVTPMSPDNEESGDKTGKSQGTPMSPLLEQELREQELSISRSTRKQSEPNSSFVIWQWWAKKIGLPEKARPSPKDMGIAKQLVALDIGIDEANELYDFLANDQFWFDKGFDLGTMLSQVGKWRSKKALPPRANPLKPVLDHRDPRNKGLPFG